MKQENIKSKIVNFIREMWPVILILILIYFLAIMANPQ